MEDEYTSTVFAAISIDMCIPASSALSLVFDWGGVDSSPVCRIQVGKIRGEIDGSWCDFHKTLSGCVIGRYFETKVVCEFLSREVGKNVHAEDGAAIDSALVCIQNIY